MRVNRSLARFTDDVYLLQIKLSEGPTAAPYEPTQLRAQAWTVRLGALPGHPELRLFMEACWSQSSAAPCCCSARLRGRIDAAIPHYDYDAVLGHAGHAHTDVLTAKRSPRPAPT